METLASEADLPDSEDAQAIVAFAMSLNGYERYGSFEKSSALAKQKPRQTLEDLRNELFFAARASRYVGSDGYVVLYRELLPLFRTLLQRGLPDRSDATERISIVESCVSGSFEQLDRPRRVGSSRHGPFRQQSAEFGHFRSVGHVPRISGNRGKQERDGRWDRSGER